MDTRLPIYDPLPDGPHSAGDPPNPRRPIKSCLAIFSGFLLVAFLVAFFAFSNVPGSLNDSINEREAHTSQNGASLSSESTESSKILRPGSRGVSAGVSEKTNRLLFAGVEELKEFPWNNSMLSWQRTAFHFQPEKNWMNDPNGPMFYKGWYHFFYQYNPNGAVWGDIAWGHAVSKDLIHWLYLPIAMVPDQWYDSNGVWSGSATILPDGQIVMLYTGSTNESVQVQNLAYPADLSDPLLINWVKYSGNPVLVPPPGIHYKDFRDPTTAWLTSEGKWRIIVGSKVNKTGISLVYDTKDFKNFKLLDSILHGVPGTGMWECVDFYPVSKISQNGQDTSMNGPEVKHVLKASLDNTRNDHYAIGTYFDNKATWVPDNPEMDVGIGLRYDYGTFYASKTFYDQDKHRRILWGWITESDSEAADVKKGWASLQCVPRTLVLDQKTGANLLQWPVEEIDSLRLNSNEFVNIKVKPGSVVPLDVGPATQLEGEKLSVRILVDHSIVESFAQGGRSAITSRVYPTRAIYGAARIFLFNNATDVSINASLRVWQMNSAFNRPYPNVPQNK
ncbi:acid beta-fructofuranosidase-like [Carica papaya]|uniref:acid beta-fructofuranosidase-like n=1 Tax=Carica papaya TaxID=3649 RepID=UPI000B8C8782|nr:acid beta-fructofuranosidase-like [Carica papaya]